MKLSHHLIAAAALSIVGTAAVAKIYGGGASPGNFTFPAGSVYVPITNGVAAPPTELRLKNPKTVPRDALLTFSAECAVSAAAGNTGAWVEITVLVNGVPYSPTIGVNDAFCSSNGQLGFNGWVRPSVTTLITLQPGNNLIQISASTQNGAFGAQISDAAIAVFD